MATQKDQKQVRLWVQKSLQKLGYSDLLVPIRWNSRLSNAMGRARVRGGQRWIEFSERHWKLASEEDKYQTVVHEVCHFVVWHMFGIGTVKPHGREWKSLMHQCDVPARRCHSVKIKKQNRIAIQCHGCSYEFQMTKYMAGQVAAGNRICKCGTRLKAPNGVKPTKRRYRRS